MLEELKEECGVYGIYSAEPKKKIAYTIASGLQTLQHRGEESCGIAINDEGIITCYKDKGLVAEVFTEKLIEEKLPAGKMGIGHVRYSTTGSDRKINAQPIAVRHKKGNLAVVHNGNLTNAVELKRELEENGAIFSTTNDTELICYLLVQERLKTSNIEDAIKNMMKRIKGAYSIIIMTSQKLIAVRDPQGFRPLTLGKMGDDYFFSSESCALNIVGAEFIRDIKPGEIVSIYNNQIESCEYMPNERKGLCIFEYIYFSRPDSIVDGMSVHEFRKQTGKYLAKQAPVEADIVAGVPDSGLDAALGYAEESGIPYGMVFIKNKYIGRSFILNNQEKRQKAVALKLNPIRQNVEGKRIVLIDDSIVRGNTIKKTINRLREFGAKEIHLRIASPMFIDVCYFGTDIDKKDKLIANIKTKEEIRQDIGVDSLEYLDLENLKEIAKGSKMEDFCYGCFTGKYPIEVPETLDKDVFEKIKF